MKINPDQIMNSSGERTSQQIHALTFKQHFAGQAMIGLLASLDWNISVLDDSLIETTASKSVKLADALINALNKED